MKKKIPAKKRYFRTIILSVVVVLVSISIFLVWVGETSAGARFLLGSVFHLDFKNSEGTLFGNIVLRDLHYDIGGGKVEFEHIRFGLKPAYLLAGRVDFKELKLQNVRIQAATSRNMKVQKIDLPSMPGIANLLNLRIDHFEIQDLSYSDGKDELFKLKEFTCSILLKNRVLYIDNAVFDSSMGKVTGKVEAGFKSFYLNTDMMLTLPLPDSSSAGVKAKIRTVPGKEKLAGTINVSLARDKKKTLEFSAETDFEDQKINIYRIQLTEPAGKIDGKATIDLSGPETLFEVKLKLLSLQLVKNTGISGTIALTGSLDKFSGGFEVKTSGQGWRNFEISGVYNGFGSGIRISPVSLKLLHGSANGYLDISWSNGLSVLGEIKGRNLDPAEINPDLNGLINIEVKGNVLRSKNGLLSGELTGIFPQSRLNGQVLTAEINAIFEKNDLNIKRLYLKGKGLELNASGLLEDKLILRSSIEDISVILPGSTGEFSMDGWIKYSKDHLGCSITGTGKDIYSNGIGIKDANILLSMEDRYGNKVHGSLTLTKPVFNGISADLIVVEADGTLLDHKISARLKAVSREAELIASGAYNKQGVWNGKILKLSGKDNMGPWQSSAPVTLTIGAKRIFVAPFVIKGVNFERIELAADISKHFSGSYFSIICNDIELARINRLVKGLEADGRFSGRITGKDKKGGRLEAQGNAFISNGNIVWRSKKEGPGVGVNSAAFSFNWDKETLSGDLKASLIQKGHLNAVFNLPLRLGYKPYFDKEGPLSIALNGKFNENGIISALNPGLIQESSGEIFFDVKAGGKWAAPEIQGIISLSKGKASLPDAGIHIKNLEAKAHLEKDLISIDSFRAESGRGYAGGNAMIHIKNWNISAYSGSITGNDFQAMNLPELSVFCSPDLKFEGDLKKAVLRGNITLPEVKIEGLLANEAVKPSSDVIVVGNARVPSSPSSVALDILLSLDLGGNVKINLSGINAQLGGNLNLTAVDLKKISAKGDIHIIKGRYINYGANLEIVKGRLYYAGGPITQPTLDILALRTSGDIKAGVLIKGTVISPVIKLYSEPFMPDTDILSYMVLGRPFGKAGEDTGRISQAAGVLFSTRQFASLQDRLTSGLGLSTVEIQDYNASNFGRMGYAFEPLTNIPGRPADIQNTQNTMLSFGKYLTPKLYFNYGRSLFTGDNRFLLRYDIFKDWQLETQTGSASGIDLFYKIEFD